MITVFRGEDMNVLIHKDITAINKVLPSWSKLKEEFFEITIFQDIHWIKEWWNYKSSQRNVAPYILEIKDKDQTIGIIPLYIHNLKLSGISFRILKPMGSELSDYLIPILSKRYSVESVLSKAFEEIMKDKSNWDYLEWENIPENSFFDDYLTQNLLGKYKTSKRIIGDSCSYIMLEKDEEKLISNLDKKLLKNIHYKERKLKKKGSFEFKKVYDEKQIEPIMNIFFELHCTRWNDTSTPSKFRFIEEREFMLQAAKNLFKSNLLHLTYLIQNDDVISVHFGMSDGNKLYGYLTAFDIRYRKFSVGVILDYHLLLLACKEGCEVFDFLRGEESYKNQWGAFKNYNVRYILFNNSIRSETFRIIYKMTNSKFFSLYINQFITNRLFKRA